MKRKSLKVIGKNGEAYSYVQEFSPLNQELPVHLTTYTMPQIEYYKELEMPTRFTDGFKAVRPWLKDLHGFFSIYSELKYTTAARSRLGNPIKKQYVAHFSLAALSLAVLIR
ncbi:hypothetical protein [Paenibacillus elgii]|uniref:hypothetical protein n=1 Tax=Paenibacillus elgii TaxID=189691 RepID=UPI00204057C0|nr:hypothetical protein [Paenibacillus elgii]MCM3271877.1 hypothetical protein [Paenibacillus elgii]